MNARRALLGEIVDYAGLFPPAALDMATAAKNYAEYRTDADAWMLGRFVVPVSRLSELEAAARPFVRERDGAWHLSALLGQDAIGDIAAARAFNDANRARMIIDSIEGKFTTPDAIAAAAARAGDDFALFAEISVDSDPTTLVAAIARAGIHAKVRTGGVVPESVPTAATVVRFMRACIDAGVAFKATAGLHHPLRAEYRMTYDASAPVGVMFGYLNVFVAAALMANGVSDRDAVRALEERDPTAFEIGDDTVRWREHLLTAEQLRRTREATAVSFGSCSFREPVDELRSLTPA